MTWNRMLRSGGWTKTLAVLSLTLAIGANSAIFSLVSAVLLRPLPYPHARRLVTIALQGPGLFGTQTSMQDLRAWRSERGVFSAVAGYGWQVQQALTTPRGGLRLANGIEATPGLLRLFGVDLQAGRGFLASDFAPAAAPVMLAAPAVERQFNRAAQIGGELRLGAANYRVVGILPPGFRMPNGQQPDYIVPAAPANGSPGTIIARLAPGETLEGARAAIAVYAARHRGSGGMPLEATVKPLDQSVRQGSQRVLLMLWGAVGLLFLIACANVASLYSARASERRREFAVKAALGASRGRIAMESLRECLAVGLAAAAGGAMLGWAGLRAIWANTPPHLRELASPVLGGGGILRLSGAALGYAVGLGILAGLLFGLAPMMAACGADPARELQSDEAHTIGDRRGRRVRRSLVIAEFALALPLALAGILLFQGLTQLRQAPAGFTSRHVLGLQVYLPPGEYPPKAAGAYVRAGLEKLRALPGVRSAAMIEPLPFAGMGISLNFFWYGNQKASPPGAATFGHGARASRAVTTRLLVAGPGLFRTLGIHVVRGRGFVPGDGQGRAAIVDERLARLYWRGEDPIGQSLGRFHVVGVIPHVALQRVGNTPEPEVFVRPATAAQIMPIPIVGFVLRTRLPPSALKQEAVRALLAVNPAIPPQAVYSLRSRMYASLAGPRFRTFLLALFAALAAALAALGMHGVLAFAVARRRRELALRQALGATAGDVAVVVLREAMVLACAGLGAGAVAALGLERLIGNSIFGLPSLNGGVFATGLIGLALLAAAGAYASVRRAMRSDPWESLRRE